MMLHAAALSRKALEAALRQVGLRVLGGWLPGAEDRLPALAGGNAAAVVWMVGQAGSECWNAFRASRFFTDGRPDPMDRWSKSIGDALARHADGVALYPSDGPPFHPFQQWALRAARVQASPLLLQIDTEFGLWHAYRFALALPSVTPADADALALVGQAPAADLCLQCSGQPCLRACPVDAFAAGGYDAGRCAAHLHTASGSDCMAGGCLARRACPVAPDSRYVGAHAAFHMAAFARRH